MKSLLMLLGVIALLLSGCGGAASQATTAAPTSAATAVSPRLFGTPDPATVERYDPARDPTQDVQRAVVAAQKNNKSWRS